MMFRFKNTIFALASIGALTPSFAIAAIQNDFSCADLRKATQKVAVHAENIANRETTRTAEGGPYKRAELKCYSLYCEMVRKSDFKLVYDRKHPDANPSGYVQFPSVNTTAEYAALNTAASEVRMLASQSLCGAKSITTTTSAMIKYDSGSSIQLDTFNFTVDGRLVSWSRTLRDGSTKTHSFNSDGSVAAIQ